MNGLFGQDGNVRVASRSKVEVEGPSNGARGHIVGSAEGRQEVIQGFLVGQVHDGQTGAPFVLIAVEQIIVPNGKLKQVA